jgi:hypothetical protein
LGLVLGSGVCGCVEVQRCRVGPEVNRRRSQPPAHVKCDGLPGLSLPPGPTCVFARRIASSSSSADIGWLGCATSFSVRCL